LGSDFCGSVDNVVGIKYTDREFPPNLLSVTRAKPKVLQSRFPATESNQLSARPLMETAQIEVLCENVAASVHQVRRIFRSPLPVPDILDRFWGLQDHLSRLLEALTDHPSETMQALEAHPRLLSDVVDVLEFSSKLQVLKNIPAVREAGENINSSLLDIQYLRQARALAVTA